MSLTDRYDEFYKGPANFLATDRTVRGVPRDRIEAIIADTPTGGTVLDVGCGQGQLLYYLRNNFNRLVGLEYSERRLCEAKHNLSNLPFQGILGSAESLTEVPSESIDCIVSADVIEHIPDVYAASDELFRILRPGGTLIMNTPNIAFIKKRIQLIAGRFPSTSQPNEGLGSDVLFDGGHLHYFTFRSLEMLLEKSGFEMTKRRGFGRLGLLHTLYPPLLSGGVQVCARKP